MGYYLGLDSSTTATKALLMNARGEVVTTASASYSYDTPRPLWSEQHPDLWWQATMKSVREVIAASGVAPQDIACVGLTGQMHGLVLLDEKGRVLRPAILWNDQRTALECDDIRASIGRERLIQITGNDALTGFTAPKILWVKKNEPALFAQIDQILLPKDYVRYKLTGQYATDKAGAAGTLLFDLAQRHWSTEMIMDLGIAQTWLPSPHEGPQITGQITEEAAAATGLCPRTPVVGGAGDQAAAAVGTGAVSAGIVSLSLGTSGVVFTTTDQPTFDPQGRLHAFCHALPGKWHLMGVMLSAAGSLRWYHDNFTPNLDYDTLVDATADIEPGCEGLLFLPYLTGERSPHPDPHARGAFVGLTVRHTQVHMTRAVLEGVAFGLRESVELLKKVGLDAIKQIRVTGGGAKSLLWRQILADILGSEIVTVNASEGAAYGAALLAAVGAGVWPDVETACDQNVKCTDSVQPQRYRVEQYDKSYSIYRQLYPALKSISYQLRH